MELQPYLDDLEQRLDSSVEAELLATWRSFNDDQFAGDIFSPRRQKQSPPSLAWPAVPVNSALFNDSQMALQQLGYCSQSLASGNGSMLNVRCNYGSSILPSLFQAEVFLMAAELDTLPTTWPLPDGLDGIKRAIDAGVPDLQHGFGEHVFRMGEYFQRLFASRPQIGKHVYLYHPDLQGPMDVCEVLCGSDMYLYLIDEPELMHAFLELITDTYIAFMEKWLQLAPPEGDDAKHWGFLHRGTIMLRDDSAMNLSPEMFMEFVFPYNQRLLDHFGGGGDHFCGRGDHFVPAMKKLRGLHGITLSQPDWNDMEKIFTHTVDEGLMLYGLERKVAEDALRAGRNLHGRVHCW